MRKNNLIDRPLEPEDIDSEPLGLRDYAKALGGFIEWCETPLTIGIQGDWGIGKTSLLNMIRQELLPRRGRSRQYPAIYINTWQYAQFSGEKYLGIAVLNALISAIQEQNKNNPNIKQEQFEQLKGYGTKAFSFLANVANQAVAGRTGIDIAAAAGSTEPVSSFSEMANLIQNYKRTFADLVEKIIPSEDGSKMVFMIDDLDRVKPARALELLEAVKIFLDVPRCVFLLAVDYSVIKQGVKEKLGTDTETTHGKSYFDKIIQVPFNMPTSAYRMDRYVLSLLGWEPDTDSSTYVKSSEYGNHCFLSLQKGWLSVEEVNFFTNVVSVTIGPNPRSIKRIVNYANLLKRVYEMNRSTRFDIQTAQLLFALAAMQLEWPELFSYLALKPAPSTIKQLEDWDFLSNLNEAQPLFRRSHDPAQLKSNITAFFDELLSVVDQDHDGDISMEEFRPLWDVMVKTNLTNATLEDNDDNWKEFRERAITNAGSASAATASVEQKIDLLRRSNLNSPLRFRMLEAGKRFFNLTWEGTQFASLVTTGGEPIQLYLTTPIERFSQNPKLTGLVLPYTQGHYGAGDSYVYLDELCKITSQEALPLINEIHRIISEWVVDKNRRQDGNKNADTLDNA